MRKKMLLATLLSCLVLSTAVLAGGEADGAVKKGYRGLTLPAAKHQLLNIKAGDRVDVLVTFEAAMKGGIKEKVTATILQNVVVLNVSKVDESLELLTNPNEAQYAALAVAQGDLWFIARAEGDTEMKPMEMASFRKLFR